MTEVPVFHSVTVGVADLDEALALWQREIGLELVSTRGGSDAVLEALWQLEPGEINRQALLATPGEKAGLLHLVEFNDPDPPVRRGAAAFDVCPKNLDIYVDDMPKRLAELGGAGHTFRNDHFSEVTAPNGVRFREMHMPAHDDINVVLLELVDEPMHFGPRGYAGIGALITIVPDADAEKAFYRDVMQMQLLSDNVLDGPEIEKMIGLPPGSALDVSIWGRQGEHFGQMEVIEYRGTAGRNLYPQARPKALGILQVHFELTDIDGLRRRHAAAGTPGTLLTLPATGDRTGRVVSLRSPAGLRIDVHERAPARE